MKEQDRLEIILEEVRSQYQAMQEGIDGLLGVPQRLDSIDGRLENLEGDVTIIKHVVKAHSGDIAELRSSGA